MKWAAALSVLLCIERARAQSPNNLDQFNYRGNEFEVTNDYGPESWGNVTCLDLDTCVSQSTSFQLMSCRFECRNKMHSRSIREIPVLVESKIMIFLEI
jgi:hypothetical protein